MIERTLTKGRAWRLALALGLSWVLCGSAAQAVPKSVHTLVMIVDFADIPAPNLLLYRDGLLKTTSLDAANTHSVLFTKPGSTAKRYLEMSHGEYILSGEVVELSVNANLAELSSSEFRAAADAAAALQGFTLSNYDRLAYLIGYGFSNQMGNGGAAQGGNWFWVSAPTPTVPFVNERIIAHELGHTSNMRHAARLETNGSLSEYGDTSDFMGSGDAVHVNATNKQRAGWLTGARRVDHPLDASASYTLHGLSLTANLPQALVIPTHGALTELDAPVDTFVSFRPPLGFDANLMSTSKDAFGTSLRNSVHIHHQRRDGKLFAALDRALELGDSVEINGTTISVLTLGTSAATVAIDQNPYFPNPPVVNTATALPSQLYPNELIEFDISVTNVDPGNVNFPAWYESSFTKPTAFWDVMWDATPKEIVVAPGATEVVSGLRVRPPLNAQPGFYEVSVTLTNEGSAGPVSAVVNFPIEVIPSPDTTPPPAPTNLGGSVFPGSGNDYVVLGWTEPDDVSDIAVYQPYRNGVALPTPVTRNPAYLDFTYSGLETNAYVVRSVDAAGNLSPPTPVFTSGVPDTSPPAAPYDLAGSYAGGGVLLTWTAPADDVWVASYRMLRNGVPIGTTWDTQLADPAPGLGITRYRAIAIDAYGNESPLGNEFVINVVAVPAMPLPGVFALIAAVVASAALLLRSQVRGAPSS